MDPNSLLKRNKNKNKSFLGALGDPNDMMAPFLGFVGGHARVAPLDPPVKTNLRTHHSIILHQIHHICDHAPLEQRVIQMSLVDISPVQHQRVRHRLLIVVDSVHEPADAAIARAGTAGRGARADRIKVRVNVVVVKDCEVQICSG